MILQLGRAFWSLATPASVTWVSARSSCLNSFNGYDVIQVRIIDGHIGKLQGSKVW